ncbi:DENN domain-containing protein Crag [Brevipalpus obovatus]|uniref:DENN domain-containing protein Crag n=1 Tax=Brevipalpus obovatus TaxID=246614 RepID=UPI003D9E2544
MNLSHLMDEKRICDYFVVSGITGSSSHLSHTIKHTNVAPGKEVADGGGQSPPPPPISSSPPANSPPSTPTSLATPIGSFGTGLPPITDIAVIITDEGEQVPEGYTCIETTPTGFPADLNHGSIRAPCMFLCYKRGTDKPPLVDVGVLYEAKERLMSDSDVVHHTPYGRSANVNNGTSKTFLTYRRAKDNASCNHLVVVDICVLLGDKGETPPHAYCLINKNLNKGLIGSSVFLCYKKSMNRPPSLRYEPSILGRFPLVDNDCYPLPESVSLFCMPMGATVECWPKKSEQPRPLFSTFVLTSNAAVKVYGAAITFYERFNENLLNEDEKSRLNYISEKDKANKTLNAVKSICILSRWPFFDTFEKFLTFLYYTACRSPGIAHLLPIEMYISHFMLSVPFPSAQRPKILVQLGNSSDETVLLSQPPEDMPLPLSGASFNQFLRNLGPENCIFVMLLVLTEQKILLHSLRPDVLTSVAEAITSLIFPFHWQCPYIPLCPLGLCDVLNAPLPFIAGVDSRYFDMYELPTDVACVDLDTNSIYISENKRLLSTKLLPKKPTRVLKNTLEKLYERLCKPSLRRDGNSTHNPQRKSFNINSPYGNEHTTTRKYERLIDLEIQEIFVKFMASILKDFRSFLRPITKAPTIDATDPNSLFDFQGFLRSRDKSHQKFHQILLCTQMFTRFIEERSFVSDKNTSLAFFDECLDKIEAYGNMENALKLRLLDADQSPQNDRTVFIPAPEPLSSDTYTYNGFPQLNLSLFHRHPSLGDLYIEGHDRDNQSCAGSNILQASPLSRRTKQEVRTAQRVVRRHAETPLTWAKCLVSYCYSLWFIHSPSFVEATSPLMSKGKQLQIAYNILKRMQSLNLHPTDEVCYRILMLLCGVHSQPILAVKVLTEMKRCGITPNAITYGYYNKAVLESKWPSGDSSALIMWTRLRNVILGIAQFRKCGQIARDRKTAQSKVDLLTSSNTDPSINSGSEKSTTEDKNSSNHSDAGYCSSVNRRYLNPSLLENPFVRTSNQNKSEENTLTSSNSNPSKESESSNHSSSSDSDDSDSNADSSSNQDEKSSSADHEDSSFSFTPLKDHIMNMSIFSPEGKVASTLRSSFRIASRLAVGPTTPKNNVPRSGSFHVGSGNFSMPEKLSSKFGGLFKTKSEESKQAKPKSLTRSATLATESPHESISTDSVDRAVSNDNCSDEEDDSSLNNYDQYLWASNLVSAKRLKLVNSTIKSATNTISNGVTGIRNTLASSAANSPAKNGTKDNRNTFMPTSLFSQWASMVVEKIPTNFGYYDEDTISRGSLDMKRMSNALSEDNISERSREGSSGPTGFGFLPQNPVYSIPFFDVIEKHYKESLLPSVSGPIVLKVNITSCNRCQVCSTILSDEEIMEAWSADDSNLSTQCCSCRSKFVPTLTIMLYQLRDKYPVIDEKHQTAATQEEISSSYNTNGLNKENGCDQPQNETCSESKYESLNTLSVPYFSPIVLRKEIENVLEIEGDSCLAKPGFLDDHPILYWNLLWYFERINLPSHILGFCLRSLSAMKDQINVDRWESFDFRNVIITCFWDDPRMYSDFQKPMYLLSREESSQNSDDSLITDDEKITQNLPKRIIAHIANNDMSSALNILLEERLKLSEQDANRKFFSLYRDLLYLAFASNGRDNTDQTAFDREYRRAYESVGERHHSILTKMDQPPSLRAFFCRRTLKELELNFTNQEESRADLPETSS